MEELNEILQLIEDTYFSVIDNDKKHEILSKLWAKYYKKSKEKNLTMDKAYELYLLGESESYIINQKPERISVNNLDLVSALSSIQDYINGIKNGITHKEAEILLQWAVENVRRNLELLFINVETNSLNGFCELGQALSIMPFEKLGLKVTKNTAKYCFNFPFNHAFGTVTFPIYENDILKQETYLIDTTYRQFFATVRCNEGRYYTKDENLRIDTAPDPGFFVTDISFSKELMKKGYTILNRETAILYGEPFYKSSIKLNELNLKNNLSGIDYYNNIISEKGEFLINYSDLDGLNIEFPEMGNKICGL